MCANFALLFIKKQNIWLHIHAKTQRQDVESRKAKAWPYMAANLIYTFSYGSIGSCHVCTTRAVRLCALALLWPLCRDIGLAPKSRWHLLCTESKRQSFPPFFFFKCERGDALQHSIRLVQRRQTPIRGCVEHMGHRFVSTMIHLWKERKKSLGTCSHWITRRFSHWLLIGLGVEEWGIIPVKPPSSICERLAPSSADQYFSSSAKWHSVPSLIDA